MSHVYDAPPVSPPEWPQAVSQEFCLLRRGNRWMAKASGSTMRADATIASAGPRLLIDLPNWLGDLVMALPATDRLIRANREGTTTLHVRPAMARLAQAIFPSRVNVVATPRRQAPILTAWRLVREARKADVGITFRNASRAKIVLWLTSRWRLGTSNQGGRWLLNWSHEVAGDRHQVHDADALLNYLGLPGADPDWKAALPADLRTAGIDTLRRAGLQRHQSIIGLAPGVACGGSAKRWPEERFGRLAASLRKRGFSPVVVIGPGECGLAATVVAAAGQDIPIIGEDLDAAGLAGVMSCLDALVGNDSGPAHTAAILGVPSLALFGPTNRLRTAPLGAASAIVDLGLECSPCMRSRCHLGHNDCLQTLSVEQVEGRLIDLTAHAGRRIDRAVQA